MCTHKFFSVCGLRLKAVQQNLRKRPDGIPEEAKSTIKIFQDRLIAPYLSAEARFKRSKPAAPVRRALQQSLYEQKGLWVTHPLYINYTIVQQKKPTLRVCIF